MNDDEFRSMVDRSTRGLTTDLDPLVTTAAARGQASLRRLRAAGAFAGAGLSVAVVGGVALLPDLGDDGPSTRDVAVAAPGLGAQPEPPATAEPQPARPDRPLAGSAADLPRLVAEQLGDPDALGGVVEDAVHPLVERPKERLVHFRWKGTLTTIGIEPAARRADCIALATTEEQPLAGAGVDVPAREDVECRIVDGVEVLVAPAPPGAVKVHGAQAWQHGWTVSVTSYNVPDGKNPDGTENVQPLMADPAIDMDSLVELVTSDIWFD